jgi:hypothetical protein
MACKFIYLPLENIVSIEETILDPALYKDCCSLD